jgi:hypothetical protein
MDKELFPQLSEFFSGLGPAFSAVVAVIVLLILKDVAVNVARGLKFYRNPAFMPGDVVILDGEPATIISIGFTETIFSIERDGIITWRYVPNTRIDYLKLEKIVK